MKPEYALGINIIIYIAIAQFVDAFTSVNTEILSSSNLYRYQTFFIFLMIVLVVGLNYLLIPLYGIKGAAISTMISLSTINIFRTIFIWVRFKIHPFERKNMLVFSLLTIVYVISFFLNEVIVLSPILKFLLMMVIISSLYWSFVFKLKLSEDINKKANKLIKLLKNKLKN
jgi:O-antigen/teichoic acid export membrane protein